MPNVFILATMQIVFLIIILALLILLAFPVKIEEANKQRVNLARVFSVFVPGLGHLVLGNWIRGVIFILLWGWFVILGFRKVILFFMGSNDTQDLFLNGLLMPMILWICALIGLSCWRRNKPKSDHVTM